MSFKVKKNFEKEGRLFTFIKFKRFIYLGVRGGVEVKALRYKPAGRGFDSQWCHLNFSVT
jgi:hypothetical protein